MSTKNNKSDEKEVPEDKTNKSEVARGPITSEDIASEIISAEVPTPPQSSEEEEKKDEKKEIPETPPEEKKEEKVEKKEGEVETPIEPFAKIGSHEFKTKEEFETFAKAQVGYNTWLTGQIKKVHPEWFNPDGSLKTRDIESAKNAGSKAKDAADTVAELSEEEELTPEQEAEMKKAKAVLKKLGVVFADDEEFKGLQNRAKKLDEDEISSAREVVAEFEKAHPMAAEHREGLSNLVREREYNDIEKAWKVFKIENGLEDQEVVPVNNKPPVKPVEHAIPATPNKESGKPPAPSAERDMIDDLLATPGL